MMQASYGKSGGKPLENDTLILSFQPKRVSFPIERENLLLSDGDPCKTFRIPVAFGGRTGYIIRGGEFGVRKGFPMPFCFKRRMSLPGAAAGLLLLAGCATADPPRPPEGPWTPSELITEVGGNDPIEGFNRSMFAVTNFGMDYIIDPLGRGYTTILPRPAIEKIDNLCVNLEFPGRAMSCLGRAEFAGARDESYRFLINTTIGVAGLFDPAANWWDIYSTRSDFGQMFAAWGIGPGCTFILPFLESQNVRDTTGCLFDFAFDIKTYIPYAGSATALNRAVMAHRGYERVIAGSADRYRTFHEMLLLQRQLQLDMYSYKSLNAAAKARKDGVKPELPPEVPPVPKPDWVTAKWRTIPGYRPQGAVLDTLRVAMFQAQNNDDPWYFRLSVFNGDFSKKCDTRDIRLGDGLPKLRYGFWKAEPKEKTPEDRRLLFPADGARPEKLLVLLPGIGGIYSGMTSTALAELFHRDGWSVASLDSSFTWQFYLAAGHELPGFLPKDAENMRRTVARVLDDLKGDGLFDPARTRVALLGYSLGAMQALKISELEEKSDTLGIDRFVAINPPVDLHYALETADAMAGTGKDWDGAKAVATVTEIAGKALAALEKTYPPWNPADPGKEPFNYSVPLTQTDADFLAALYFRSSMSELLLVAQREKGVPVLTTPYKWSRRNELYREIDRVSFAEYAAKVVAPALAPLTTEELYRQSSLRAFAESLARNPKVRVVHSLDDFLLTGEDRRFLDRTLGRRLTWFDRGGHLGNLYVTDVQQTLLDLAGREEAGNSTNAGEKAVTCN